MADTTDPLSFVGVLDLARARAARDQRLGAVAQLAVDAFRAWMSLPPEPAEEYPTQEALAEAHDAALDEVVVAMAALEDALQR